MIKKRYAEYKPDTLKIGFYVPFDKWFDKITIEKHSEIQMLIERALLYLEVSLSWKFRSHAEIKGKLAWSLLNLGTYLDLYEKGKL
jgi:hypothetical protein